MSTPPLPATAPDDAAADFEGVLGESAPPYKGRRQGWSRPVAVPASFDEMHGPLEGNVSLPIGVYSSGAGTNQVFQLERPSSRGTMYEIVLTEGQLDDVRRFVNGDELRRMWPTLFLPAYVRQGWEERHPSLSG